MKSASLLLALPVLTILWPIRALSQKVSNVTTYTYPPEGRFADTFTPLRDGREIPGSKRKAKRKPCSVEVQAELHRGLLELLNDGKFLTGEGDVDTSIRAMSITRRPGLQALLDPKSMSAMRGPMPGGQEVDVPVCHTHIDPETWDHLFEKAKHLEELSFSECTPPAPKSGYSPPEDSCLHSVRPYPNTDDVCQIIGENDLTVEHLDDAALLIGCPYHEPAPLVTGWLRGRSSLIKSGHGSCSVCLSAKERTKLPASHGQTGWSVGGLCAASP